MSFEGETGEHRSAASCYENRVLRPDRSLVTSVPPRMLRLGFEPDCETVLLASLRGLRLA